MAGGRPKKQEKVQEEEKFVPETVDDGVTREQAKENPMDLVANSERKRKPGNWKKVSPEELAILESEGLLIGYDPATGEVLTKEN